MADKATGVNLLQNPAFANHPEVQAQLARLKAHGNDNRVLSEGLSLIAQKLGFVPPGTTVSASGNVYQPESTKHFLLTKGLGLAAAAAGGMGAGALLAGSAAAPVASAAAPVSGSIPV